MARLFTLAQAEALLPRLIPILETIQHHFRLLSVDRSRSVGLAGMRGTNGHSHTNGHAPPQPMASLDDARRHRALAEAELRHALGELLRHGVELKDPQIGLIDFQHQRDNRIVYLCWKLGEARIAWWHELDTGVAGRIPLERSD